MKMWAKYLRQNHWLITPAIIFQLLLPFVFLSKIVYTYMSTMQWDPIKFWRDSASKRVAGQRYLLPLSRHTSSQTPTDPKAFLPSQCHPTTPPKPPNPLLLAIPNQPPYFYTPCWPFSRLAGHNVDTACFSAGTDAANFGVLFQQLLYKLHLGWTEN